MGGVNHSEQSKVYLGCIALENESEEERSKSTPLLKLFKERFFPKNIG